MTTPEMARGMDAGWIDSRRETGATEMAPDQHFF